ncbi:Gastrin-releasing peptide [Bagarius yarrelli]|uniref:Gastrin-releasing peptide n=1 Tax=Bagarius yarrelli TaxID=175774 RepID=A0A556V7U0_BAGYA|nr:Gastrin-releasing peptide [Bagarius yarrelli]
MWGYRPVMWLVAVLLVFLECDAQLQNDAQSDKLMYAPGNHWAVGHLMGKKSTDEMLSSDEHDVNAQAYLFTAKADAHTQPFGLLQALVKFLAGPERETKQERERQKHLMERRKFWEKQLARQKEVNQVELTHLLTHCYSS